MSSHNSILAQYTGCISALTARFSGHGGIDRPVIVHWLTQFDPEHVPLALKLLENVSYFTQANVRGMCREIVDLATMYVQHVPENRFLFVAPGRLWQANVIVARSLVYSRVVGPNQIVSWIDLRQMRRGQWDAIVVFTDFSGTGNQLCRWWETTEPLILPLEAEVVIGVLVLNYGARERLEGLNLSVLAACELDETRNVFHEQSTLLSEQERRIVLQYCKTTGARPEYVKGYGQSGLLVAFDHGCPNNSIPLLWHRSDSWQPLFKRHI